MTNSTPLKFINKLSGNPPDSLKFSVKINSEKYWDVELADPKATRALVSLMDMYAVLGGAASHYGGPAAFAELMSALHAILFLRAKKENKEWFDLFNFVNDAGHCENGLYALKANYGMANLKLEDLKHFRSIKSKLTGHGESHLFPEGVLMSNGPLGSAFPQSQGLAMADALAGDKRVTVTAISDGACMEGEAREAFAAIPGFAKNNQLAPYVLIISDNNTKLSGRIDKECFSMTPTFNSLNDLGWKVISLDDGHNLKKCFEVIDSAIEEAQKNPQVPIVIHAKTIKGIGTKKTAESASGGHGFPLKSPTELAAFLSEIYDGHSYPKEFDGWISELIEIENRQKQIKEVPLFEGVKEEKIQTGIANAMIKAKKAGLPLVSVTSDLPGSTGVAGFRKEFPKDSFDVGIAESNMISVAAGFSKRGFIPVVDTFAQFGVTKGALPLTMAALSEAPMIAVFSHTGFQDAADGASHQALGWLAMVSSIPYVDVYALTSSSEAEALMTKVLQDFAVKKQANQTPNSTVFFLGRENFPQSFSKDLDYQLGKAQIISDNTAQFSRSVTLLGSGSMLVQAVKASRELEKQNIGSIVVNPAIHNHPDLKTILPCVQKTKGCYLVVEDHQVIGGFGQLLTAEIAKSQNPHLVKNLGVQGAFGQSAYTAQELYEKHGLAATQITSTVIKMMG
jgi:transketolase